MHFYQLPHQAFVHIKGEDAEKFLQGQLTCDMAEINQGRSLLSAHCNPQGRVISLFRIQRYENGYLLILPRTMLSTALENLNKYSVFFKASLTEISPYAIGVKGESLSEQLKLAKLSEVNQAVTDHGITVISLPSHDDQQRLQLIGDQATLSAMVTDFEENNSWQTEDILAGLPMVYPETSTKLLAHRINLIHFGGVSFNKGCYTGQEIIARMEFRGQIKHHLYLAKLPNNAKAGATITFDSNKNGIVVDCVLNHNNESLGLVILKKSDVDSSKAVIDLSTTTVKEE